MPKRTQTYYMHTLDGKPANFDRDNNGAWLTFADERESVRLVASLSTIRRREAAVRATHKGLRWRFEPWRYGYVRVEVPVSPLTGGEE